MSEKRIPNVACSVCGNRFYARPCEIKKGRGKYCSQECYHSTCVKYEFPIHRVCSYCEKDIVIIDRRYLKKRFCSNSCSAKSSNRKRKGIQYKCSVGIKNLLIAKYGKKCMIPFCNYDICVDLHHIQYRSTGGDNGIDNCLLLCPNHHREVHMKRFEVDFLRRVLDDLRGSVAESGLRRPI